MKIKISKKAREALIRKGLGEGKFLRLKIKPGGCAGNTYEAEIVQDINPGDEVIFRDREFQVVSDMFSKVFLDGLDIDYSDDLISAGFRFSSPQNQGSCGCGGSFNPEGTVSEGGKSCG